MSKKNAVKKMLEVVAIKIATRDANVACPYLTYQPMSLYISSFFVLFHNCSI